MPTPIRRSTTAKSASSKTYGHPREWASDTAAEIASKMFWTADALAEHCGNPAPKHAAREAGTIRIAYRYLEPRIDQLATMPGAEDAAGELAELHRKIRSGLGKTRAVTRLNGVPCIECNVCALTLHEDNAICGDCGRIIERKLFGLLARHWVDTLIDEYDAKHAATA